MSLFKRLILILAGIAAAYYVLGIGQQFSTVRLGSLFTAPKNVPPEIWTAIVALSVLTVATVVVNCLGFLSNLRTLRVSYTRVFWTMALLIGGAGLFGMLLQPDMSRLFDWFVAAHPLVQVIFAMILLPSAFMIAEIGASVIVAIDEHDHRVWNNGDPLEKSVNMLVQQSNGVTTLLKEHHKQTTDALTKNAGDLLKVIQTQGAELTAMHTLLKGLDLENLQNDLNLALLQLGYTVDSKGDWHAPKMTFVDKLEAVLEADGFTQDADGAWTAPETAKDDFDKLHGRLDGAFAKLKDVAADVGKIGERVMAVTHHMGIPDNDAQPLRRTG